MKALVHALFGHLELIFGRASIFNGLQRSEDGRHSLAAALSDDEVKT